LAKGVSSRIEGGSLLEIYVVPYIIVAAP
jgi:hypothetical protein